MPNDILRCLGLKGKLVIYIYTYITNSTVTETLRRSLPLPGFVSSNSTMAISISSFGLSIEFCNYSPVFLLSFYNFAFISPVKANKPHALFLNSKLKASK